ncbi:hypothetical protein PACTADRAFT_38824 [Pachysolen tannophilus NRRL Y-2460]|uniref:Carboxypeptidase n=1 Tax=Pachysolen tannophilus NRRL Y-2460 TaxID=669874 RepID=A0A1E4TYX8_PACTA|nr:hypothetical protein PACTADRAFT_38824 [Pachysolen tannophilus NRRL Y-2460]
MTLFFPDAVSQLNFASRPRFNIKRHDNWNYKIQDNELPNYQLRAKNTPKDLGVDDVTQYSGYLDVEDEDKHFFFWFFESRNDPKNDPIILWLNGGPGCSSLTGLFFELGPSSIDSKIKPIRNPTSWNSNASVIFLDQPVNVGYSYSSSSISNTVAAGKDVYAFLQLFFKQFPQYSELPFHIAGESYAGHYIPQFAAEILEHTERNFNLSSVMIGNGLTDPLTQYNYYEPMACGEGSGADSVLEPAECEGMLDTLPRCLSLIESCYESGSAFACVPATIYCNNGQIGPYQKTGRNVYDIRKMCEGSSLCYKGLEYIDTYLNQADVKEKLGVEVDTYESCNFDVNRNFVFAGDWMKPYFKKVTELLDGGLPVLIYAGDKDFICNWLGNQAWTNSLPWSGADSFQASKVKSWAVDGKEAGKVKNSDIFTFMRVYGGGHMVPYDQPESSLALVNTWISGDYSFGTNKS